MTTSELPTTNWCATRTLVNPERNRFVHSADEVAAVLSSTTDRIQILGARFSYPALIEGQDATTIHLRSPERILACDASTITVTGDCTLTEMWEYLRARKRTLPVAPPVITAQTVAGAIGTPTHAQGSREGLLADCVLAIGYVDGTGHQRRIERGAEGFGAFQLHLGALGVITSVTLAVVPNRRFTCHKYTTSVAELQAEFAGWTARSEHVKAWWFTEDDRVHVWEASPARRFPPLRTDRRAHTDLNAVLVATQDRLGEDLHSDDRRSAAQRTVSRFYDYSDVTGDLFEIFRNGIPAPQINMEVAVPLHRFEAAADDLARMLTDSAYRLHYPVILRPTGPSEAWLSGSYARPVCWFGFVVYQRADASVADGSVDLLGEIQDVLAAHEGVPHWGKYFDPAHYDFRAMPRWADFARVRRQVDPADRFCHPRLAQLLEGTS